MQSSAVPGPKADLYARVTDRIVEELEAGVRPWLKPWSVVHAEGRVGRPLRHNGVPYRGVNVLLLWSAAMERGFASSRWITYRQAQALGAQVRKGETGSLVVFADRITKTDTGADGEDEEREVAFLKAYHVFNVEQIDGLPASYVNSPAARPSPLALHAASEAFFARTGAVFRHGGNRAFYAPARDVIQLPPVEAFRDAESYAATKAHELTHWTGHSSRLAREFGKRFGDQAYAFEELVAELGAAFLCADLGVTPEVRLDHAGYLANWLQVLKANKRAIFTAAAEAQKAADFLNAVPAGEPVAEVVALENGMITRAVNACEG